MSYILSRTDCQETVTNHYSEEALYQDIFFHRVTRSCHSHWLPDFVFYLLPGPLCTGSVQVEATKNLDDSWWPGSHVCPLVSSLVTSEIAIPRHDLFWSTRFCISWHWIHPVHCGLRLNVSPAFYGHRAKVPRLHIVNDNLKGISNSAEENIFSLTKHSHLTQGEWFLLLSHSLDCVWSLFVTLAISESYWGAD